MNQGPSQQTELFIDENDAAEKLISAGNHPEAAGILVSIIQKDDRNWRAYNNIGILSWVRENWVDAYTMFKKAVSVKPDYADALVNLFDAALKLKKVDEIRPLFEVALQINPSLEELAVILEQLKLQGDDIYICKRALQLGTWSPLIDEAKKTLEKGNYTDALALFLKSNDTEGPSAAAFCGMGIVAFHQKKHLDAMALFMESLKLNPLDFDTHLNLLDAGKACGRVDDVKKIFDIYRKELPELEEIAPEFENLVL
jgi:tetratricopeptide (TPR) repeat protein